MKHTQLREVEKINRWVMTVLKYPAYIDGTVGSAGTDENDAFVDNAWRKFEERLSAFNLDKLQDEFDACDAVTRYKKAALKAKLDSLRVSVEKYLKQHQWMRDRPCFDWIFRKHDDIENTLIVMDGRLNGIE